jgi:hypothetical protein
MNGALHSIWRQNQIGEYLLVVRKAVEAFILVRVFIND